ncbi:prenyltransferase [Jatrophihabitans fulvus]
MTAVPAGVGASAPPRLPAIDGVASADDLVRTAAAIEGEQHPDGLLPWFAGYHADPWDHVEAAMGLTVAGRLDAAAAAYRFSAASQRPDGSWPMEVVGEGADRVVREAAGDTNQAAYLAVGVWHHWLVTGDIGFARELWPAVRAAVRYALAAQRADGTVAWARDAAGEPTREALLTGSACLVLSLRCGVALADLVGDPQPSWTPALTRLAHAVAAHPDAFADRSRFSMDWYYPVLGGAVRGHAAHDAIARRWDEFVVAGRGCRCVADRPWVTAAETCELVLTLDAMGDRRRGLALLRDVQFLRDGSGGYWTGWVFPEEVVWPRQQTTWTAGALLLAVDALTVTTGGSGVFRGDGLAALADPGCGPHCP